MADDIVDYGRNILVIIWTKHDRQQYNVFQTTLLYSNLTIKSKQSLKPKT